MQVQVKQVICFEVSKIIPGRKPEEGYVMIKVELVELRKDFLRERLDKYPWKALGHLCLSRTPASGRNDRSYP